MSRVLGLEPYSWALLAASLVGSVVVVMSAREDGITARRLTALILLLVTTSLLGAKLVSAWERGGFDPLLFELGSGFRYPGGVIGLALGIACARWTGLYSGPTARLADLLAAAIPAGMAVARLGCLSTGCCFGTLCNLPWAVTYQPSAAAWVRHVRDGLLTADAAASLPVHPLPLYEAALYALLAVHILRSQRRPHRNGEPFAVAMIGVVLVRLGLSPFRADLPNYVQVTDAVLLIGAIAAYLTVRLHRFSSSTSVRRIRLSRKATVTRLQEGGPP